MGITNVSVQELKEWVDNDEVCLIDVREAIEHSAFHINNSAHLPVGSITKEQLPETDKKVVIYCLRGVRGQKACEKVIAGNEDLEVYNLTGGIAAWKSAGLPLNVSEKQPFPLERQVQITIGSVVLLSIIASMVINPLFVWVAAFFGAGLLFAGLTGTCALGMIIARMPWNKTA